jgi:hypothetical protein
MIAAATGVAAAALSVSPARVRLTRSVRQTITIRNTGDAATSIDVRAARFVLDPRGKPVILPKREAGTWLRLVPRHLALATGAVAEVTVWSIAPPHARPGDHPALVLVTTQAPRTPAVAVRMRIGVVVFVRVPGRVVHRLALGPLEARHRVLEAGVANRGNVVELARVSIAFSRAGHVLARLRAARRTLLPHSSNIERLRYPAHLHGWVTAEVAAGSIHRRFRLRL